MLRQLLRNTENTVATAGFHSSSASVVASLNVLRRNDAPVPTAIAPPEQQRAVPPSHTPLLPVPSHPPTFTEFMATVPHASSPAQCRDTACNAIVANAMRFTDAFASDDTSRDTIRRIGHAGSVFPRTLPANNVFSPLRGGDFVPVVSVTKYPG